jgi:hypothetical protein
MPQSSAMQTHVGDLAYAKQQCICKLKQQAAQRAVQACGVLRAFSSTHDAQFVIYAVDFVTAAL